jgi:paraquat-inducible protein B
VEGIPPLLEELQGLAADARTIPFAELSARLDALLASADALLSDEALAELPADVSTTLAEARRLAAELRGLVASDGVQALPGQAGQLLAGAEAALADLRGVVQDFQAQGGTAQAVATLEAAEGAARDVSTAIEGVPALLTELQTLAADARSIPFAELSARLDALLVEAEGLLGAEALGAVPADVAATLAEARALAADLRGLVASDGVQALPGQAGQLLAGAEAALADLRGVVQEFQAQGGTAQAVATLEAAESAARDVSTAIEGVPALLTELQTLAADARSIPFAELSARLDALLVEAEGLLGAEALGALPADVAATLGEARALAADLRGLVATEEVQGLPVQADALLADLRGAVADLRGTLVEIEEKGAVDRLLSAIDSAALAADEVGASVSGVPLLVEDLRGLAGQAGELPLEALTAQLTETLAAAQRILDNSETQAVPASLNAALADLEAILEEVREGGAVASANSAFSAAERAATSLAGATADLPTLIRTANTVLAQANTTLASLDGTSEFGREARQALREVQRAAAAVASLARTLERRPNSILLGR